MAEKELVYNVKLDLAAASAQAQQLRAVFQQQLKDIDLSAISKSAQAADTQAVASAKAAAQERIQAARAEAAERIQAAKATANAEIEEEKRATASLKAELAQRSTAARQQVRQPTPTVTGGGGGGIVDTLFNNLSGAVVGGLAGYLTVQGAKQLAQQTVAFAEFGTQVRRTEASFKILSGSAGEAEARIKAIQTAGGGAVSSLQAMELANQAVSLHLASTAQEFGNLTKAGREIALVSPVIHDVQSAISELGLASANLSYRRLDQLGLSAGEVKARMRELQAANSNMDESQAFLAASIDVLNTKYGDLLKTHEAQASGVEKLKVAFSDLWAEIAKGPVGKGADSFFAGLAKVMENGVSKSPAALMQQQIEDLQKKGPSPFTGKAPSFMGGDTGERDKTIAYLTSLQKLLADVDAGVEAGIPRAKAFQDALVQEGNAVVMAGEAGEGHVIWLQRMKEAYAAATQEAKKMAQLDDPEARRVAAATQTSHLEDISTASNTKIKELSANLHDMATIDFFKRIQDGLSASATLTATSTNRLAEYRLQLELIANRSKDGKFTPADSAQVDGINRQIAALAKAKELNDKLQTSTRQTPGQNLDAIYARLNAIIAQTKGHFDETANSARAMGDAIAQSGSASADQMAEIDQMAQQANSADFSRISQSLRELNSASLDAVPGVDNLRDKLSGYYETLASGKGLTADAAAELAQLTAEADYLGSSTSALASLQSSLGYSFLESHTYVAALVEQVANLESLYAAGSIGADQFAGGMNALTGELYSQLQAAGALTPKLAQLLSLLGAVRAASGMGGTAGPFFGGFGGGGSISTNSPGYLAGQAQAQAAAAAARTKADSDARAEALKAQKHAAGAAQSAFEDAAKGTQKAFESVVDDLRGALQKVEGLFSPSKVTAEDMALSKAGLYTPKADELLRQVKSAAENEKDKTRFAGQIKEARAALERIGVAPAENLKALAAQLEQAWSSSALFSNKENLKLINKDAVKFQLDLAAKAKQGQENIYEFFGATLDSVKEKFAQKDPTIVGAVAAELQATQDKNLKALGKSLEDGVNGAVEKVLKNLAAAEAGFGKGGGSGGGGGSVSVGAIPTSGGGGTWIDTVAKNVDNAYQNLATQWAQAAGVTMPKMQSGGLPGGLYGPPAPNQLAPTTLDTSNLQPIEVKAKLTTVELAPGAVAPIAADIVNQIAAQFDNPANRAVLAGKGVGLNSLIQSAFTELAVYQPMAAPFVNEVAAQFENPANRVGLAAAGVAINNEIQNGVISLATYKDMTEGFVRAVDEQFLNENNVANYNAVGQTIRDQIVAGISSAEATNASGKSKAFGIDTSGFIRSIQNSFAGTFASRDQEGADGRVRNRSAFDFSAYAQQITRGLQRSIDQAGVALSGTGDNLAGFIGSGLINHDFAAAASSVIGTITASFTTDQAKTQLSGAGSALSAAIFQGFASSLAYQPWISTIVSTVVEQALDSLNTSVQDSLQTQSAGV